MNKKGNVEIIAVVIIVILVLGGLGIFVLNHPQETGGIIDSSEEISSEIILAIANLPESSDLKFNEYTEYLSFVSKTNILIKILNEKTSWFKIDSLDDSYDSYIQLSKSIEDVDKKVTKWGPLVNNYNEVIESAKIYTNTPTEENRINFYSKSAKFGFEFSIIGGAVFFKPSYQTVGALYRASGLSSFAKSCPTCIETTLSITHWEIRNELGELSLGLFDKINDLKFDEKRLEKIDFNNFVNKFKIAFWVGVGFTSEQVENGIYYLQNSWEQIKTSEEYNQALDFVNETTQKTGEIIGKGANDLKNWWEDKFIQ